MNGAICAILIDWVRRRGPPLRHTLGDRRCALRGLQEAHSHGRILAAAASHPKALAAHMQNSEGA